MLFAPLRSRNFPLLWIVEDILLRLIFDEVFSPETVAYVNKKVNEALARRTDPPGTTRKKQVAELAKAREELENIKNAIRHGILTPTTRTMLEEAEKHVGELEATLKASATKRGDLAVLPSVVEGYLKDLRGSLGRYLNVRVNCWPNFWGRSSFAVMDDQSFYNVGAGRGI